MHMPSDSTQAMSLWHWPHALDPRCDIDDAVGSDLLGDWRLKKETEIGAGGLLQLLQSSDKVTVIPSCFGDAEL